MINHELARALREIALMGPAADPGDVEHDSLEAAEAHGIDLGLFQAAVIARSALAALYDVPDRSVTQVTFDDLTADQIDHLAALADALREVEVRFHPVCLELARQLDARKSDPADWLADWEGELNVGLHPPDGDPSWDDEAASLIGTVRAPLKGLRERPVFGFGAVGVDHSEPGRPLGTIRQPWIFHAIVDHSGLELGDVLRTGLIWLDLTVTMQASVPVSGAREEAGRS